MRIKLDDNELDTMKELLTMALNAVIAEFLNVGVGSVRPGSRLVADLGMSPAAKQRLQKEIEMPDAMKVEEPVDQVANIESARLEAKLSVQAA